VGFDNGTVGDVVKKRVVVLPWDVVVTSTAKEFKLVEAFLSKNTSAGFGASGRFRFPYQKAG